MRCALLIADLEGVAGVDALEDLVAGSPGYPAACERLTAEINAAIEGLLAAGFERVRVSDTHQSGSGAPNVLAAALPPQAELRFEENPYAAELFEGVEAVACLGMHAAAGSGGFGAHTVDPLGVWRCGERRLSETELVLALAHEAGVPCVFVSGDDVLGASLGGGRYVETKRALSPARSESRGRDEVLDSLRRAAREAPRPAPPTPDGEWTITFRSARQAELAAASGAERLDRYRIRLDGATVRERIDRGLSASGEASAVLAGVLPGTPGDGCFTEVAAGLLSGPATPDDWPSRPIGDAPIDRRIRSARSELAAAAHRALGAFLEDTRAEDARSVALRALALHMLEGHAPRLFREFELPPVLAGSVEALSALPPEFPAGLPFDDGVARADALYVRRARGLAHPAPDPASLRRYLASLDEQGYGTHAWMIGELAAACGVEARLPIPERPLRLHSHLIDLYWLTHLILFDTAYLVRRPASPRLPVWIEELLAGAPWALSIGHFDLAAELAFCLQSAGEAESPTHAQLLHGLLRRQSLDGRLGDEGPAGEDPEGVAHTTAAALIALAGAAERATK